MVLVIIVARALIYLEMLKLERRFLNDWVEDAQRRVSGNEFQFGTKKKCRNKHKERRGEICGRHDRRPPTTPLHSPSFSLGITRNHSFRHYTTHLSS